MTSSRIRRLAAASAVLTATATGLTALTTPAAAAVTGTVETSGGPLTVRRAPTTSASAVGAVADGASVAIDCQTTGTSVTGPLGTTTIWDHVPALGGYVSDAHVRTGSDGRVAPDCGVGTGSAACSTGACAGEASFDSAARTFTVRDRAADGRSAVVAYWLGGGIGPLYAWNSGGNGTAVDRPVAAARDDWVYYRVCVADYSATDPKLLACSAGLTDYAA